MRANRKGFALIATLWLLVAISAVTLEMGLHGRILRTATANRVETSRATAAARAGLQHARAELTRRAHGAAAGTAAGLPDPWAHVERLVPASGRLPAGGRYAVTARDAGALLNLNRASEVELRRFMRALAVDDGRADRIAQAIMDWKDTDDLRRARGAEAEAYIEADAPVLPANGGFAVVAELRDVLGMTGEIYDKMAPLLSVSGSGRVNLASAPVPVLSALPGMEPALVRAVLERRRRGPLGSVAQLATDLPPDARAAFEAHLPELLSRTTVETGEVELLSEGWLDGSPARARAEALVVRSGGAVFLYHRGRR